ncbi:N-acetylmuramoyl-L-alanine amidase [Phormidesmis priestleyi ULC007]|uniref:N-acetylmuramoyl-L-alanine amidase n=1 Tax=Phormidesmis priestleyi ULC007 TaxID=1920490 RepID=A0A2T1DMF7_9CYAN|nr:peptidoglycan recognition family protein [Phormidesmis priestleyi]PSB21645.1 N-acetylmuramoyl-L-alanine amidase [Phormidesmis priestleyi ULC007]PZO54686.1 MAG: N-acetylmuramoyl-L-alanine amidase [Phormidesmis priestleyi]
MRKFLQVFVILALGIAALILTVNSGDAQLVEGQKNRLPSFSILSLQPQTVSDSSSALSSACALKPIPRANKSKSTVAAVRDPVPLSRFRQDPNLADPTKETLGKATPKYNPREEVALAHPTNFGRRFVQDLYGKPADNAAIVVLHETVGSAQSTIGFFQTPHPNDNDQVSYHTLITLDGTIVYLVPPDRRAFGAGNSVFVGETGQEAVQTNPDFPPSVNNFAYHISLVTPPDGRNNTNRHSGYTRAQYQSLAWLVAKTGVPESRITTHRTVDRSRQRKDPRSFDGEYFSRLLSFYPKTQEISTQCSTPAVLEE